MTELEKLTMLRDGARQRLANHRMHISHLEKDIKRDLEIAQKYGRLILEEELKNANVQSPTI